MGAAISRSEIGRIGVGNRHADSEKNRIRRIGELSEGVNIAPPRAAPLADAADGLLARRAADGDVRAFEILLRRHAGLMTAYAARLTGSQHDASDAVQEASVAIWRELPTLTAPDAVRGWMMRIVSRKAFDLMRARKPADDIDDEAVAARLPSDDSDDPARIAQTGDAMAGLRRALDRLPPLQRQSWILREVGGESYGEIAEHLGITTTAARGQLARARQTLTTEMEAWR